MAFGGVLIMSTKQQLQIPPDKTVVNRSLLEAGIANSLFACQWKTIDFLLCQFLSDITFVSQFREGGVVEKRER